MRRVFNVDGRIMTKAQYDAYMRAERPTVQKRMPTGEGETFGLSYRKGQCSRCGASLELAMSSGNFCGSCGAVLGKESQSAIHHEVDFGMKVFQSGTDQKGLRHRG